MFKLLLKEINSVKDGVYIYNSVWWHNHRFMIDRFMEFINEVNLILDRE